MLSALAVGPALWAGPEHHPVRYVVDGDTLDVSQVGRVRLLGIDAPETGIGLDTPAAFAREARALLATLVGGRYVSLEADGDRYDKYGRRLAYVLRDDGLLVNAEMLRAGLARISARRQLRRLSELRAAERAAKVARRGMWGARPVLPLERPVGLRRRDVAQGRALLQHTGIAAALNDPGKPWQSGADESFNWKLRDECLSLEWFRHRIDAKHVIEHWRRHDNELRPYSSLGCLTPTEFKQQAPMVGACLTEGPTRAVLQ